MAKEIDAQFSFTYTKGNSQFILPGRLIQIDSEDPPKVMATQSIGTTYEALEVGDVSDLGMFYVHNTDPTNFVDIGIEVSAAFESVFRLQPGQIAFVPMLTKAPFAKADTAAVALEYMLFSQ